MNDDAALQPLLNAGSTQGGGDGNDDEDEEGEERGGVSVEGATAENVGQSGVAVAVAAGAGTESEPTGAVFPGE